MGSFESLITTGGGSVYYQEILDRHNGNRAAAGRELGMSRYNFRDRLNKERAESETPANTATDIPEDSDLPAATVEVASVASLDLDAEPYEPLIAGGKPKLRARVAAPVSSKPLRVCGIGDGHVHPGIPDNRRFELIGHHIAATNPEHVVQIGDFADMNSMCHHVRNDTFKARQKPTFRQDMASFLNAIERLEAPIRAAGVKPRKHMTFGNHDEWLWTYEDQHPECDGALTSQYQELFTRRGWTTSRYGSWYFLGGVGFTHAPLNIMGKPFGGLNAEGTLANWAMFDVVMGHTHRRADITRPKLGVMQDVRIVNLGSAMPEGYVGDYAKHTPNAYFYGICDLVIQDGHIVSTHFIPMKELEARYGHLVA